MTAPGRHAGADISALHRHVEPAAFLADIGAKAGNLIPCCRARTNALTRPCPLQETDQTEMTDYFAPTGGLPPQTALHTGRAVFTESYAVIPRGVFSDIVTSYLPGWAGLRCWIIARPMTGFSETFSQYVVELLPGGGSDSPEPDPLAEGVMFLTHGTLTLTIAGTRHVLAPGGYAYLPAGCPWTASNEGEAPARFHWVRKRYEAAPGIDHPTAFVTNEKDIAPTAMPDTNGAWATTRFVDPSDLRHDMHVNIVTFQPGGLIPFEETHIMEHGLYVLEGKAVYRLNRDWVEVEAGDFMWLRAYCPQACYAGGPSPFRYLLYKDVNRHVRLGGILGR
jgi:(S)-ureidoglycine aminohydrolase